MVGETALPADNDSISYQMQVQFIKDAYRYTIDVAVQAWLVGISRGKHTHFEAEFTGLLTHEGKPLPQKAKF